MCDHGLEEWLETRKPDVPAAFLPHLLRASEEAPPGDGGWGREALTEAGLVALGRALNRPGRDRGAAFHLLTADALLTYGCEAAAQESDPRRALRELLDRLGGAVR